MNCIAKEKCFLRSLLYCLKIMDKYKKFALECVKIRLNSLQVGNAIKDVKEMCLKINNYRVRIKAKTVNFFYRL